MQYFARLTHERVAAEVLVLLLHLAEACEQAIELNRAGRVGQRMLQVVQFVMERTEARAGDRLVDHGAPGHLLDVLPEIPHGELLRHRHRAIVRRFLADDHAKQCGLARAVRADKSDLLSWVELERRVDEEYLPTVLLADAIESNHCNKLRRDDRRRVSATESVVRTALRVWLTEHG